MKKITFDSLPEAISEILNRIEKIENILSKQPGKKSARKALTGSKVKANKKAKSKSGIKISGKSKASKSVALKADPDKLNLKETVKLLNISVASLYSYVKNKKIPFSKNGNRLVFSKAELEKWQKGKKTAKPSGDNITAQEAQKLFNKPLPTVYYIIKTRKLAVAEKKGKTLYYSKKDFAKALKQKPARKPRTKKPAVTNNEKKTD